MAELNAWIPKLLLTAPSDRGGLSVSAEYWNSLWLANQEQGDDTTTTLKQLIDELLLSIWHPTDGADHVSAPPRYTGDLYESIGTQLRDTYNAVGEAWDYVLEQIEPRIDDLEDGTTPAGDAAKLGGALPAAYAQQADLTTLEGVVAALAAGEISAFSHNDIGNRDATGAHPISAITDLATTLATLGSQTVADITYDETNTLAAKLTSMDALISLLSGGISAMNHADLLSRDATGAHPQGAITGLVDALAGKQATITGAATTITEGNLTASRALVANSSGKVAVANTTLAELNFVNGVTSAIQTQLNGKQKTITASTSAPTGGADGDVWVVYSA